MKAWKLVGYIFTGLGTISLFYGFFDGFMQTINPAAMFSGSSDPSIDSFFSQFISAIAPWMILATYLFVVGGVGLYVGRDKKRMKPELFQDNVNFRFDTLEETMDRRFQEVSKRLDVIEEEQKKTNLNSGEEV
jgi:hypothetical protein